MRGDAAGVPSLQSEIAWVVADGRAFGVPKGLSNSATRLRPSRISKAADGPLLRRAISGMASNASLRAGAVTTSNPTAATTPVSSYARLSALKKKYDPVKSFQVEPKYKTSSLVGLGCISDIGFV
jgi:hypothetical protein